MISKNTIKGIIGIQGGKGSFNEQAILEYVKKHKVRDYKIKYLYTSEKVLKNLHQGDIEAGLFAIHNSVGGMVEESIQAMANYKFKIMEEFAIRLRHFLMKKKDVEFKEIKTIMAHPQVFKQCRNTLEKKYPKMLLKSGRGDLIDHAVVAKKLAGNKINKKTAVLGPGRLAELYDLEIVDRDLQDNKENWTSFLLVKRQD